MVDQTQGPTGEVVSFKRKEDSSSRPALATENKSYSDVVAERNRLREDVRYLRQRVFDLERLADTDPLLPINNRRVFIREIRRALSVADRYAVPSAVVYFDVDNLKLVNDQMGHVIGDRILLQVAETLTRDIRKSDLAARIGGDEFGVMLFQSNLESAERKAADLASTIARQEITVKGKGVSINVTWGVCLIDPKLTVEEILALADERMYARKDAH